MFNLLFTFFVQAMSHIYSEMIIDYYRDEPCYPNHNLKFICFIILQVSFVISGGGLGFYHFILNSKFSCLLVHNRCVIPFENNIHYE